MFHVGAKLVVRSSLRTPLFKSLRQHAYFSTKHVKGTMAHSDASPLKTNPPTDAKKDAEHVEKVQKGSVAEGQETQTPTDVRPDKPPGVVSEVPPASEADSKNVEKQQQTKVSDAHQKVQRKDKPPGVVSGVQSSSESHTKSTNEDSNSNNDNQKKRSKLGYASPLFSGLLASYLVYLFVKNTLSTQTEALLFNMDTLKTIKTMEQIEEDKFLKEQQDKDEIKRRRAHVLEHHVENLDYETSAWLRFIRSWNSIWKNLASEIDNQYNQKNTSEARQEQEKKRLMKLGNEKA